MVVSRKALLLSAALGLCLAAQARAQETADPREAPASQPVSPQTVDVPAANLQDRPVEPPPPSTEATSINPDEVQFNADQLDYDYENDIVTASGDVRLYRRSDRLRAEKIVWNRKTGKVVAEGNIVIVNPEGDAAYGDRIELTDTLKDGAVENMLVVLEAGGRIAAQRGHRDNGIITVENAAYTPCAVTDSNDCPKEPSWKITARRVVYDPNKKRIRYTGARISVFGIASIPLPVFSHPAGGTSDDGFLTPDVRLDRTNGFQIALPYFFSLAPNRDLTITPRVFTEALPMLQGEYRAVESFGAYRVTGYGTYSRRADDLTVPTTPATSSNNFRGYLDASGRFQFSPEWSASASIRLTTDRTFLRRYDISRDDRLRNNVRLEHIDSDSYFSINAWAVQTLRVGDRQGSQPFVLPELDYRRRMDEGLLGGRFEFQLNTLAIGRSDGQDSQRAFASARWDLRKLTNWGQEVTFTAYGRADAYNTDDTLSTLVPSYRGDEGFRFRGIAAAAIDVKWPFVGEFLGGTQKITPRIQIVAAPKLENLAVPNEDARAVDLEDSNLFALNRFPGYDRFEDSTRFTWGVDYALYLPGFSVDANVGQSYRLTSRPTIFPDGTGLADRVSDIVGRTVVRFRDFVSFTHRYRIDKDTFAIRRNEIDATVGSRSTYFQVGYLRLNRNIDATLEDLQDREEARIGGRVQIARFWSVSGALLVDLTNRDEDILSQADGFDPVRHRLGVTYEDDCLRLGLTWKRDYETTGDARRGNSFLLSLAFKNLGR
ncbi:LPS-assembly protein LptD [Sphingomonas sp. Root241]|uniref:LPS-assembly protein LptD n=1 Tax=Sphingomonas sp. Root241 TaxID=1736501 RepID=UPI0006F7324C|nr:LPS assembly protein LptD [Sphingomonas sp. Root241]KRC81998.1 organic solvent tolerance protein [Sphingomonas sp. Root241]